MSLGYTGPDHTNGHRDYNLFSLHYQGPPSEASRLNLPEDKMLSAQLNGIGYDGNIYRIGLSGKQNPFGNFVVVGSSSIEETVTFKNLVSRMETLYTGKAEPFTYAFNRFRPTVIIGMRAPSTPSGFESLNTFIRLNDLLEDMRADLYFEDLDTSPILPDNLTGKVITKRYRTEVNRSFEPKGGTYITRVYLD